jgi:uncharacterized protein GlcG (DUF336 family)
MVSLADARRVIAAAEKKAAEIGQPMNIAVVDEGANLGFESFSSYLENYVSFYFY